MFLIHNNLILVLIGLCFGSHITEAAPLSRFKQPPSTSTTCFSSRSLQVLTNLAASLNEHIPTSYMKIGHHRQPCPCILRRFQQKAENDCLNLPQTSCRLVTLPAGKLITKSGPTTPTLFSCCTGNFIKHQQTSLPRRRHNKKIYHK